MTSAVYAVTHAASGRQYVGLTSRSVQERWLEHLGDARGGSRTYLHNAIRKYGAVEFNVDVLAEVPTPAEAQIAERIAIATMRPAFNLTAGGDGMPGYRFPAEECQARRLRALAITPEQRERMAAPRRGRKHSAETKAKISASKTGKPRTPAQAAANEAKRGRKLTPEHCAKLSAAQLHRYAARKES